MDMGVSSEEEVNKIIDCSPLASHVIEAWTKNSFSKKDTLIEQEINECLRALNGEYDPEDVARIVRDGSSKIYMQITATKIRAGISWISDILLSPSSDPFSLQPTPTATLPESVEKKLIKHFATELEQGRDALIKAEKERGEQEQKVEQQKQQQEQGMAATPEGAQAPPPPPPGAEGPQEKPPTLKVEQAQSILLEQNRLHRDIKEALLEEINAVARFEMKRLEREVTDQLKEGNWDNALYEFIEDFCTFPAAFMKGPVITKKKKLHWVKGEAVPFDDYSFQNKRVSPYDIYPDPSATLITDGNFIEHMRLSEKELRDCIGLPGYIEEGILSVLENGATGIPIAYDTGIEYDKAELEKRGDTFRANEDVFHALHFWGPINKEDLEDWGVVPDWTNERGEDDPAKKPWISEGMKEMEIIMVGHVIIKCVLNSDPLFRRPYYKASYQNIPGAFWGRSMPSLMRDIQRMCNACARALATNMGYSSGPIINVNIDRLADSGDIDELRPLQVLQTTSDPTGNSGKPVEAFLIPSVAQELLAVYEKFEVKADDATGIPRYAYGNTQGAGGALATAKGLATMLESATKSIKDAIRHISRGLIIPRIEQEVLWTIINKQIDYNGDINVVAYGAEALASKGANEERRQQFLQSTANQIDQGIMGVEGRAELLREMAKDLGLSSPIVPSRLELRRKSKEMQKAESGKQEAAQQQLKAKEASKLKATSIQIEGQERMSNQAQEVKGIDIQRKQKEHDDKMRIEVERMKTQKDIASSRGLSDVKKAVVADEGKRAIADQSAAVTLSTNNDGQGGGNGGGMV